AYFRRDHPCPTFGRGARNARIDALDQPARADAQRDHRNDLFAEISLLTFWRRIGTHGRSIGHCIMNTAQDLVRAGFYVGRTGLGHAAIILEAHSRLVIDGVTSSENTDRYVIADPIADIE